jgi:hypothetical protein
MVQPPIIDKISALIKNNQLLNDYRTCLLLLDHQSFNSYGANKIYRLKEDQAFSLSLELGQREKVARHPSSVARWPWPPQNNSKQAVEK